MKWSEQLRVLQSEDEHYNQLMLDTDAGELFINDERIDVLNSNEGSEYIIEYSKFIKIIKKYPFFTDLKFLLNCIFKGKAGEHNNYFIYYSNNNYLHKYEDRCQLHNVPRPRMLTIYLKPYDSV